MGEGTDLRLQVLRTTLEEAKSLECDGNFQDPCVICLESITEKAVAVPCRHQSFDFICLISWLQENSSCPLCKRDVARVEYEFDSNGSCKTFDVKFPQAEKRHESLGAYNLTPAPWVLQYRPNRRFPSSSRPRPRGQRYRPGPAASSSSSDTALERRRHVYQHHLYSAHVGSNRISRFQDLTPSRFNSDPELATRARKWIRRELQVFDFLSVDSEPCQASDSPDPARANSKDKASHVMGAPKTQSRSEQTLHRRRASNAEFLLEYILAILKTVDIKSSQGQAEEMLAEFLGRDNAQLFLHELRAWLRSPYTELEGWDRHVQYPEPGRVENLATENGGGLLDTSKTNQPATHRGHVGGKRRRESDERTPTFPQERSRRRGYDRYIPD